MLERGFRTLTSRSSRSRVRGEDDENESETIVKNATQHLLKYNVLSNIHERTLNKDKQGDDYITSASLSEIWKDHLKAFIKILLPKKSDDDIQDVYKYTENTLLLTISILVRIEWTGWDRFSAILELSQLDNAFTDARLPDYTFDHLNKIEFLTGPKASDFFQRQHSFKPVTIKEGSDAQYPRWSRLPLYESQDLGEGGFGFVTKHMISKDYFELREEDRSLKNDSVVARKRFMNRLDFNQERRNLINLHRNEVHHDRLVSFLAIISIGDWNDPVAPRELSIITELAKFDLEKHLDEPDNMCLAYIREQLYGISKGLYHLHVSLGTPNNAEVYCHGDLKPQNILIYIDKEAKNKGRSREGHPPLIWKIADFGISFRLKREEKGSDARASHSSFESPELQSLRQIPVPSKGGHRLQVETGFHSPEKTVSLSSDIWSFGCIIFQVLVRGVEGREGLKNMNSMRAKSTGGTTEAQTDDFFRYETEDRSKIYLNPAVAQWLNKNGADGALNPNRGDNGQAIANLSKLVKSMLNTVLASRVKIEHVCKALDDVERLVVPYQLISSQLAHEHSTSEAQPAPLAPAAAEASLMGGSNNSSDNNKDYILTVEHPPDYLDSELTVHLSSANSLVAYQRKNDGGIFISGYAQGFSQCTRLIKDERYGFKATKWDNSYLVITAEDRSLQSSHNLCFLCYGPFTDADWHDTEMIGPVRLSADKGLELKHISISLHGHIMFFKNGSIGIQKHDRSTIKLSSTKLILAKDKIAKLWFHNEDETACALISKGANCFLLKAWDAVTGAPRDTRDVPQVAEQALNYADPSNPILARNSTLGCVLCLKKEFQVIGEKHDVTLKHIPPFERIVMTPNDDYLVAPGPEGDVMIVEAAKMMTHGSRPVKARSKSVVAAASLKDLNLEKGFAMIAKSGEGGQYSVVIANMRFKVGVFHINAPSR